MGERCEKLDYARIETHGDLGIAHDSRNPPEWCLVHSYGTSMAPGVRSEKIPRGYPIFRQTTWKDGQMNGWYQKMNGID